MSMSLEEAKIEAVRRWGYQAWAVIVLGLCVVNSRYNNFRVEGDSFEAAFKDAEAKGDQYA